MGRFFETEKKKKNIVKPKKAKKNPPPPPKKKSENTNITWLHMMYKDISFGEIPILSDDKLRGALVQF